MLIRPDGSDLKALTSADENCSMPTSWGSRWEIYRLPIRERRQRGLADPQPRDRRQPHAETGSDRDNFPSWSQRGNWIAFTSRRDGDYEIYIIHPDGTGLKRLTRSAGNDAHASFSPDGEWIAFATARGGSKTKPCCCRSILEPYGEIAVMRLDGSEVHVLTNNATEEGAPSWVPKP